MLARHANDEARHAAIFRRLLSQRGFTEEELPQHGANYELAYAFPECGQGSQRELVWRLLILCTVLEGLAIDRAPVGIATRDWLAQPDIARALDYIGTDAVSHVDNGLRLTRQLCDQLDLDPIVERERVQSQFSGRQRDIRVRCLQADPERAAREIDILAGLNSERAPFASAPDVELRRPATFAAAECAPVTRWDHRAQAYIDLAEVAESGRLSV
jgi:hypothetical protein